MSNISKEGHIIAIDEVIKFDSGFTKREFVIKTSDDGEYAQDIKMELIKDKTALTDQFEIGDQVRVSFNIKGREYNQKYYVNLVAWKIESLKGNTITPENANDVVPAVDDIPF